MLWIYDQRLLTPTNTHLRLRDHFVKFPEFKLLLSTIFSSPESIMEVTRVDFVCICVYVFDSLKVT